MGSFQQRTKTLACTQQGLIITTASVPAIKVAQQPFDLSIWTGVRTDGTIMSQRHYSLGKAAALPGFLGWKRRVANNEEGREGYRDH
jgi:hypothetical protein